MRVKKRWMQRSVCVQQTDMGSDRVVGKLPRRCPGRVHDWSLSPGIQATHNTKQKEGKRHIVIIVK